MLARKFFIELEFKFDWLLQNEQNGESIDAHIVKQTILHAIENWSENNDQED